MSIDLKMLSDYLKYLENERNRPLEMTTSRELKKLKKTTFYSHTLIRVQFPDGITVFAKFAPLETVQSLQNVLKSLLKDEYQQQSYELYTTPPKTVYFLFFTAKVMRSSLQPTSTFRSLNLVPSGYIYFTWKVHCSQY